ncbi:PQQ-binding-like beta-propeller repeat protein [Archangium gephyra]|nr:PQQ-binding-like beta-propeller repeat protein [Archangium gephyra]
MHRTASRVRDGRGLSERWNVRSGTEAMLLGERGRWLVRAGVCSVPSVHAIERLCPPLHGVGGDAWGRRVVGAGPVPVTAELRVGTGLDRTFPETLTFSVVASDGGAGGTLTTVTRSEGVYSTQWTPAGDGEFRLKAAHPQDGGPSATVSLTADTTGPTFVVFVPPADAGVAVGGTTYGDTEPGFATAWRRDQVVPVEIRTNEPHLDPSTVTVTLRTDAGTAPAVNVTAFAESQSCDAGFCGLAQVDLWVPTFNAFRGPMNLDVQGTDTVGNTGTSSGLVNVTRWKWRHDITGATITAAPVLGNTGVVYVGTTNGSNDDGQLLALSTDGRVLWAGNGGAVVASPTVGNLQAGGTERVYVAHKKGTLSRVGFYDSSDGGFTNPCADINSGSVSVQSSLAFAQVSAGANSETVYGVYTGRTGGTLFALRPDAPEDALVQCPSLPSVGDVSAPGTMLAAGNAVVFGTTDGALKSYALNSSGIWSGSAQWTQPLSPLKPTSIGAADGGVFGGGNDGSNSKLFQVPLSGMQAPTLFPTSSQMWNVSIGGSSGSTAVVGLDNSKLFSLDIADGGTRTVDTPGDIIKGAPVWGAGGYVYTSGATSGVVQVRRPLENVVWQFEPGSLIEASMNLDCKRLPDGGVVVGTPGVLYAATRGGRVYALVVDSPGLDTSAPWPKYQHDSRNTGNPATPITSCP